jgi:hypothetical protein
MPPLHFPRGRPRQVPRIARSLMRLCRTFRRSRSPGSMRSPPVTRCYRRAVAHPARGGPPARRLRRARDRPLASRCDHRRGALPDGPRRGDHRARRNLRGGAPRLPTVRLADTSRRRAVAGDRARRSSTVSEPIAITAARGRQGRAPLARPGRRTSADARRAGTSLAAFRADACQDAAADRRQGVRRRDATTDRRLGGRIPRRPRRGSGSRHRPVASIGPEYTVGRFSAKFSNVA